MLETQCIKIPVISGKEAQVREWIAALATRHDEVIEAIVSEKIHDEAVFCAKEPAGTFLYLYSRSPDLASAGAAFQASELKVDQEFKQILGECLDFTSALSLELLFCADGESKRVYP